MDASNLWPTDITKLLFSSFVILFQACDATSSSCQSPLQQVNWSLDTDMASLELTTLSSRWTPLLSCQCVLGSLSCCMMKDLPISLIVCFWNWQIKSFCILLSQFCCLINRWMSLLMSQKKLCRTPSHDKTNRKARMEFCHQVQRWASNILRQSLMDWWNISPTTFYQSGGKGKFAHNPKPICSSVIYTGGDVMAFSGTHSFIC